MGGNEIAGASLQVADLDGNVIDAWISEAGISHAIETVEVGLIHISHLADKRVENVKDIVSVGDVVDVKIIDIDIENKRISISMRALLEDDADAADEE